MSLLKTLPEIRADNRLNSAQFDLREDALAKWIPEVRAAEGENDKTISMYAPIGENWDGTGVTAKRIGAALRAIGNKDVTVNVNSPGGDFFEGVAIYNLLRAHPAKVTINVMGLAASAASVIAMAGDEIHMGEGAFLMIHNAWVLAAGNRHDLREAADYLEPFDVEMQNLYAARTGLPVKTIAKMMDKESYIGATQAIADGFATGLLDRGAITSDTSASAANTRALALVESAMAKAGYSRSARRDTLQNLFTGKPGAAPEDATPGAGEDIAASLHNLIQSLKG